MPRYRYRCKKCEDEKEVIHRMSEKLIVCDICEEETLERIPSELSKNKIESIQRPGAIVDSYIENTKKQIDREKKKLKEREV